MVTPGQDTTYPDELGLGRGEHVTRLRLQTDYYAILGELPVEFNNRVVARLGAHDATILRGTPPHLPPGLRVRLAPVYETQSRGALVVPTGAITACVGADCDLQDLANAIEEAGYCIDEVFEHARSCGRVRARSGSMADALAGLDRLAATPGIESVEPVVLRSMARKPS